MIGDMTEFSKNEEMSIQSLMDKMGITETEAELLIDCLAFLQTDETMLAIQDSFIAKIKSDSEEDARGSLIGYGASVTHAYIMYVEARIKAINSAMLANDLFKNVADPE